MKHGLTLDPSREAPTDAIDPLNTRFPWPIVEFPLDIAGVGSRVKKTALADRRDLELAKKKKRAKKV